MKAAAQYKKQDGEISLSSDHKVVIWAPAAADKSATVRIAPEHLTNLQQTPATKAKAVLKLFVQVPGASAPETFTFTFTSPSAARDEMNALIEPLKRSMERKEAGSVAKLVSPSPAPSNRDVGQSASMAIAQAVSSTAKDNVSDSFSDSQLLSNITFQKALIDQNPVLRERLTQAMRDKPSSMTAGQLSKHFWASRIHLLRAHAAEQAQTRGEYNVIADIRPERHKDGEMKYNFTPAKFRLIWQQYPFLLRVHNELFKRKVFTKEEDFWGEWVTSRLYKKMKGEKITEQDYEHPHFDRFLDLVDTDPRPKHFQVNDVPRFIDLDGNEQNHSQRAGNAPDFTMKPSFGGRNAILNTLNNMSERLLMNVAPSDSESHGPAGVDEDTFNELRLRDLQRDDADNRILLDINDQRHIAPGDDSVEAAKLTPAAIMKAVEEVRSSSYLRPDLPVATNGDEDEVTMSATNSIMKSIKLRASHTASDQMNESDTQTQTKDAAIMTHSTTIDFLHYFWGAYLSGDPTRADDVRFLYETLENSHGRFEALGSQAESERKLQYQRLNDLNKDLPESKRRRIDTSQLPSGQKAVEDMLAATEQAVRFAETTYKRAIAVQTAQSGV